MTERPHRPRPEERPRAERRAEGQYNTPAPLVDPIIRFTLDPLLQDLPADRLTVCDPACGDGALLVGAFRCLLRCLDQRPGPEQRVRLLLDTIHGLDRDRAAAGACRRALLAAALSGGGRLVVRAEERWRPGRALPAPPRPR